MRQRLNTATLTLSVTMLFFLALVISGCSGSSSSGTPDLETQMNGKWQRAQGDTVEINLGKKTASLTIDGHVYPVVVEKVDKMANTVELKVDTGTGNSEKWSLHQMWNDNGSEFKLTLRHNGTTETLTPVAKS